MRAYEAQVIIDEIEKYQLLDLVKHTGDYLQKHLTALSHKYPQWIQNVRGTGTYMAFDVETSDKRDLVVKELRNAGINIGGSGNISVRMRPMLIFSQKHADVYLDLLEKVVRKVSQ